MGHNELLVARSAAEACRATKSIVSVKFGALRDAGGGWLGFDARPAAVKNFLAYTLQRLGTRPHRHLSAGPARSAGADRGYGRRHRRHGEGRLRPRISACPRSAPTRIRRAAAVHPICDLQIEYSLISRGIEDAILPACRELGVGITAYGVLSRGLISGHWTKDAAQPGDFARSQPALSRPATSTPTSPWSRPCAPSPGQGCERRPGRHRLGPGAGRRTSFR